MIKKLIVFLLLAGAITYVGILFVTPQYHYQGIKSDLKELVVLRNMQPREIREEMQKSIDYYEAPIKNSSILIDRLPNFQYQIRVSWSETVNLLDLYEKTYRFSINSEDFKD